MLCSVVLVSAIQQHESAISIHIPAPSWTSPPASHLSRSSQHQVELPVLYSNFPLAILHVVMYLFQRCFQFIPSSPSSIHKSSLCVWACRYVHQYHFSSFHIYIYIYSTTLLSNCFTSKAEQGAREGTKNFKDLFLLLYPF